MKKTVLVSLLSLSSLFAQTLVLQQGTVTAHTEVFGDSHIEPATKRITSHLTMDEGIASIHGSVDVSIKKLKSDNAKRDAHMEEALQSDTYPLAHFTFQKVSKNGIDGVLKFHGVQHPLHIDATVTDNGPTVKIKGKSHISLADYKVKPIKLFLMTVRDRIDLRINVTFTKR